MSMSLTSVLGFATPTLVDRSSVPLPLTTTLLSSTTGVSPSFVTQAPSLHQRADALSASSSYCPPNEVVVQISTQLLIPDYSEYYATPIQQFSMSYISLPDGSLVAPPYFEEIRQGNELLLFIGMFLMLFTRNAVVSADYIRRGRVKRKGLFYTLLLSQILGVATFVSLATTFFASRVNCRIALVIEIILTEISGILLLSGILGVKAYRCLNDSLFVIITVGLLQFASTALVIIDLVRLRATRKLSGSCAATNSFRFIPFSIALQFAIALFISLCFLYALWKSSKHPAAQGRISIALTDRPTSETSIPERIEVSADTVRSRGWWDYVPEPSTEVAGNHTSTLQAASGDKSIVQNLRSIVRSSTSIKNSLDVPKQLLEKPGIASHRHSPKHSVHFQEKAEKSQFDVSRTTSPVPSQMRNLGRLMNRMKLFKEVLRNELGHTALITLANVVATVLAMVGVFGDLPTSPAFLIGADWAILSLLVIHSFGRVVARHEREALLQHPSAWDPLYYVEKATNGSIRRALSSASVASNPRRNLKTVDPLYDQGDLDVDLTPRAQPSQQPNNPFEDFEFVAEPADKDLYLDDGTVDSWRNRAVPTSVPSSPSLTHTSSRFSGSQSNPLSPRFPLDLFYKPQPQPLSPVSKYSEAR